MPTNSIKFDNIALPNPVLLASHYERQRNTHKQ